MLDIIGISPDEAISKYNIATIEQIIDKTCTNLLKRITDEESHPLTSKLNKVSSKSKAICRVTNNKIRTKAYENSFVQKYLRTLRSGVSDLYTTRSNSQNQTIRPPPITSDCLPTTNVVKSANMQICKSGAGIKAHIRLVHNKKKIC